MKVLVTGGAGFIGSHVVDQLLCRGDEVRVIDRIDPTIHPLGAQYLDPRAEFVAGDLRDVALVGRAVKGIDAVCHQAAKVGLGVDFGDIHDYVAHNDAATAVLLAALWRRSFGGRFVLASSMVVYGEGRSRCGQHGIVSPAPRRAEDLAAGIFEPACPLSGCGGPVTWDPVDEEAAPDPRNIYAATKLHQEHLAAVWGRETGASVIALRYHNVYGPRMPRNTPYAGVASIFRSSLGAGRPAQVFEDGRQCRDFVHVRDVADANVIALTCDTAESGAYNVASGTPHTIGDMAEALTDAFGPAAPRPQYTGQWRAGDVRHIVASAAKAADRLGFVAKVGFDEGMAELAGAPQRAPRS
ncbi:MAG TPA: NAD-dependent epimerase/dehydratase family protein [Acidimicrobiales bacterium]